MAAARLWRSAARQRGSSCLASAIGLKPASLPSSRSSPLTSQPHRLRRGEVVEVGDALALVAQEARAALGAADAADHRAGVDDEVVVAAVEPVDREQLQLRPQALALDVAGDHAEIGARQQRGVLQQPRQRCARHHRLEPRQGARIGALLHHREQEVGGIGDQPVARQQVDDAEPPVEAARSERGAARRAGDAHEAAHADAARVEQLDAAGRGARGRRRSPCRARPRRRRRAGRGRAARRRCDRRRTGGRAARGAADRRRGRAGRAHISSPTSPPRECETRCELRARGQPAGERERVLDRALGEGAVLEGVDVVAVARRERAPRRRGRLAGLVAGGRPEVAEAAGQARHRAVQEDEHRPVGRQRVGAAADRFERRARLEPAAVEAGRAALELALLEGAAEQRRGLLLEVDAEELEHLDAQAERAALEAALADGAFALCQAGPRRRVDAPGRRSTGGAARDPFALLAQQVVGPHPQHEAVLVLDPHDVVGAAATSVAAASRAPPSRTRRGLPVIATSRVGGGTAAETSAASRFRGGSASVMARGFGRFGRGFGSERVEQSHRERRLREEHAPPGRA